VPYSKQNWPTPRGLNHDFTLSAEPPVNSVGFISAFKCPAVRILATSRASSKLAQSTVSYGAMVYLAAAGGNQLQVSLVAASTYVSALLFGLQGGTLADFFSKRMAIVAGYVALASLCIFIPVFFGTSVTQLMVIIFISSALMQVVSPSLKSAISLVSSPQEMATVSALVSIVGSIASALGSSMLAPLLIKTTSINTLLYVAGAIYLIGAVRTYRLPVQEKGMKFIDAMGAMDWRPKALSRRSTAEWLIGHRSVGATNSRRRNRRLTFRGVHHADSGLRPGCPQDKSNQQGLYFCTGRLGFLIGTLAAPRLIRTTGARKLAVVAEIVMAVSMILFGLIGIIAPIIAPLSPLRIFGWLLDIDINDRILAARLIAVPANFGSTAAGAAVQIFINKNVSAVNQGSTFGTQEVQENIFTLMLVIALGVFSQVAGSRMTFFGAPLVAVGLVVGLIRYSYRVTDTGPITFRQAIDKLLGQTTPYSDPEESSTSPDK